MNLSFFFYRPQSQFAIGYNIYYTGVYLFASNSHQSSRNMLVVANSLINKAFIILDISGCDFAL